VVLAVESDPGNYGRVALLVGARSPSELQFTADMERWKASSAVDVYVTVDRPDSTWDGPVGVVTRQLGPAGINPDRSVALLCGPEIMMRFAAGDLLKLGVPAERIYASLERNMECGVGLCGHCVIGDRYVCWGGPVVPWSIAGDLMRVPEL
jgi:NAD(P)H-flavin reductase